MISPRSQRVDAALSTAVLVAVPIALVMATGRPHLPHHVDAADLRDLAALLAWCAWGWCVIGLIVDVHKRVRAGDATHGGTTRTLERLAARVAGAILALSSIALSQSALGGAVPARPAPSSISAVRVDPVSAHAGATLENTTPPLSPPHQIVVVSGESLWSIAEETYGDGDGWTLLAAANLGHTMNDGLVFTDPSLIMPGWVLVVPSDSDAPHAAPVQVGPSSTEPPSPDSARVISPSARPSPLASSTTPKTATPSSTRSTSIPHPSSTRASSTHDTSTHESSRPASISHPRFATKTDRQTRSPSDLVEGAASASRTVHPGVNDSNDVPAKVLAPVTSDPAVFIGPGLGTSLVTLGLLARRRRRRHTDHLVTPLSEELLSADVAVARLAVVPMTSLAERAALLAAADEAIVGPCLLVVGPRGARLVVADRVTWRAEPVDLEEGADEVTHVPGAFVPLGNDDHDSWILIVPPGSSVNLGGSYAPSLLAEALTLQPELAWGPFVTVASDSAEVHHLARCLDDGALVISRGPTSLAGPVAVITTDASVPSTIAIERDTVSIAAIDTHLTTASLGPDAHRLLDDEPDAACHEIWSDGLAPSRLDAPRELDSDLWSEDLHDSSQTIVRLLTATPRIDGLADPIEPKRVRRAIELVAYLALHHPTPVTGDRIRTRVLGTSDHDAATKTLFNVASAARRALGMTRDGTALLPPAGRDGQYRLSSEVTTDLALLTELVDRADRCGSEDAEAQLLDEALSLVEGEPLSTVLVGYEWFLVEGHQGRLDSLVERAAARLVELSLRSGDTHVAQRALAQARLVVPFSELLAAAAMEIAAADGDLDGLRRAFEEMARVVDEIDPGSWPVDTIEERYGELRRSVLEATASQASLAAIDDAPRSTNPSAPAAL